MIPGLENAEFFRLGAIHRNTFINAPQLLNRDLSLKSRPEIFFAGQMIGVEGYVESSAMGLVAGLSALCRLKGDSFPVPPVETAVGALLEYVSGKEGSYQPMNINFGLLPGTGERIRDKKKRNANTIQRALELQEHWLEGIRQYRRPEPA